MCRTRNARDKALYKSAVTLLYLYVCSTDAALQGKLGVLQLSLCYQPASETITIVIMKARDLKAKDINGLSGKCATDNAHIIGVSSIHGLSLASCTNARRIFGRCKLEAQLSPTDPRDGIVL